MEPKVSSIAYILKQLKQHREEKRVEEKNQALITVAPSDEDRNIGLRIERAGKKAVKGMKEVYEHKIENEKKVEQAFIRGSKELVNLIKETAAGEGVYHITKQLYEKYLTSRQEENNQQ